MSTAQEHERTAFVHGDGFAKMRSPASFPYDFNRGQRILDHCRRNGLLDRPWMELMAAREASREELLGFHTARYLDALAAAGAGEFSPEYVELGIGVGDCPLFYGMQGYAAVAAGATLTAAEAVTQRGARIAFNPSGGLHHAGSERAEGFCYVNDIAVAVAWLRRASPAMRICYIDVDAHHPNGVQDAFYGDPGVLCVSMHQTGRTLYPYRGFEDETGEGAGGGFTINVPLEPRADDDLFQAAFDRVVLRAARRYAPDLVIAQLGVDMLHGDPLTDLNMTNNAYAYAARGAASLGVPLVALGGGGYNRAGYVPANALVWAALNGIDDEEQGYGGLVGGVLLGDEGLVGGGLREARRYTQGPEKARLVESLERTIALLEKTIPLLAP